MTLDLLLIALIITLEPIPLTAFILILQSKSGVRKGAAFIFGWLGSLAGVVTITVLSTGDPPPGPIRVLRWPASRSRSLIGVVAGSSRPAPTSRMGRPEEAEEAPEVADRHRQHDAVVRHGLGPLTQPWGLVAAGVATIREAKLTTWESYVALSLSAVATGRLLAMEIYAALQARTDPGISGHGPKLDRPPYRPGDHRYFPRYSDLWLVGQSISVLVT